MSEQESLDDDATFVHEPHPSTPLRRRTVTGVVRVEECTEMDPDVLGIRELGEPLRLNGDTREQFDMARLAIRDAFSRLHPGTIQILLGEQLANLPDERAVSLLMQRACSLEDGCREDFAEVLVSMVGQQLMAAKKAEDEARDRRREIECSLLRIIGPYRDQIFEGS